MKKISLSAIIILLLVTASCNKDDDFINLKSTLNIENSIIGATEGKFLYINLSLTDPLSQDLILEGNFSTEGINGYINEDDYKKELEYSTNGKTWKKETNTSQVKFKAGTSALKIRIATVDDNLPETTEEFKILIAPINTVNLNLTNHLESIGVTIKDNDITERPQDGGVVMEFEIADNHSGYKVVNIVERVSSILEKEVVDGKYKRVLDDALKAYKLLPPNVKVVYFQLIADPSSGLGGYVFNRSGEGKDEWVMAMNVGFAYRGRNEDGSARSIEYNSNGEYGNIFIHELGHIITLNYEKQITFASENEECDYLRIFEGCSKPNSHINLFNTNFYDVPVVNEPTHVTNYAKTNIAEDLAETFAHYMIQNNIPSSTLASSGALQKLNFINTKSDLTSLKSKIKDIYQLGYISPQDDVFAKHVDKNGKPISCLNYKELLKKLKKED